MTTRHKPAALPKRLRTRAEKLLAIAPPEVAQTPVPDVRKLVHELQVHQIALELQNEQLRRTELQMAAARERYADLYHFAPVAYLTLNSRGEILEANLHASELLGLERGRLILQNFTRFVAAEAQDAFYSFCRQVFASGIRQSAEMELVTAESKRLIIQAEAVREAASSRKQGRFSFIDITERKRAGQASRESEERYRNQHALLRTLIDLAPDFIFVKDTDSRYLVVNESLAKCYGRQPAEMLNRTDADFLPPELAARFRAGEQQALAADSVCTFEDTIVFPGARPRAVVTHMVAFRDQEGNVGGLVGIGRDITGYKQAEAALRESEEKYRRLFEISVDAIILAEPPSGTFTAGNLAALKMFGAKSETEFVLHGPLDLSPERQPDGRFSVEKAREMIETAMREGSHFFEWTHRRITGEEFYADVLLSRMEREGKPVVLATVRDITGRKRAENALRTSERNLRILTRALEQSPASVVITNTAGEIEYVNPKFSEVTGYSLAEVLGQNPRLLKSGHQSVEFYREMWTTITSGRDWRGELCNRKKNGALFWESAVIAPIHDEHGTVTHFVALKEDITERRRLEAELLEVADREQQRIGHDLHDGLGQRLTALEMKCFLLQEDLATTQHRTGGRKLQQQAQHISRALRECIAVTRSIAHGLAPVVLKTEGLTGALAQLAQRTRVPGKLECRLVCPRPVALDDFQTAKQLFRIAQEAVNNALKHARTRHIRIHLAHVKGMLCLQIKDVGRGLPEHTKPASGMGLEVMRHRAHAIGATLEIHSKPGKGVSVICTLPINNYENQE